MKQKKTHAFLLCILQSTDNQQYNIINNTKSIIMKRLLVYAFAVFAIIACSDKNAPSDPGNKEGLLKGKFCVSTSGVVQFSKGNLQYQASTDTWRFAGEQYTIVGENNDHISKTGNMWIDLFGWGTGKNPSLASTENIAYSYFADWGINKISNGGNINNQWRTLTADEWAYLFHKRRHAQRLLGFGSVCGVNGVIILPDNCVIPSELFTPCDSPEVVWVNSGYYYNEKNNNFTYNTYTSDQWKQMEEYGAVFLPAAGYRAGTFVHNVGAYGSYWSSSLNKNDGAFGLLFNATYLYPKNDDYKFCLRYYGKSVRLVQEAR